MLDTNTTDPGTAGYIEIAPGIWLESGAIDPCRSGRLMLIEPRALVRGNPVRSFGRVIDTWIPLSVAADAVARVTGWTMIYREGRTRPDGWVVCVAERGSIVSPLPTHIAAHTYPWAAPLAA